MLTSLPDVENLDEVIPGSGCQPVSIVVPLHTYHCSLVGMAKFRKDCVKVKLNSHIQCTDIFDAS